MKTNRQSTTCQDFHYPRQASCNSRESGNPRPKVGYAILSIIVAVIAAAACSNDAPQTDIDATIQAEVATQLEAQATSQAVIAEGIQATMEAIPTQTRTPTPTQTSRITSSIADVVEYARAGVVRITGSSTYGSGFVVDSDGHILTNAHVIDGATRLTVVLDDGTRLTARVVGTDPMRDIALIKVEPRQRQLTVLPLVKQTREGEEVVALGYPLGGGNLTVTKGIVSVLVTRGSLAYIQTDAALNPGNSGGPLLNSRGEVVGMNTSVLREDGGDETEGIGFAIKSDTLRPSLSLLKTGLYPAPTTSRTTRILSTPTPTPRAPSSTLYGPSSGLIDLDDGYGGSDSYTDVADFMASVTFRIPNITGDDSWTAGFVIRATTDRQFARGVDFKAHLITIGRSGSWVHGILPEGAEEWETAQDAFSSGIETNPNEENHIRVIAQGTRGWLFINGNYEADLDLSGITDSGTVSLGVWSEGPIAPTRFQDFTIREIRKEYGPRNGAIEHDPDDGNIDAQRTYIRLNDGIIEAQFSNPYSEREGDWSSGFLFRNSGQGQFHVVVVNESAWWYHGLRTGDADHEQEVASETSTYISTGSTGTNHIRIIILGPNGWLFVNGNYIAKLRLGGWIEPGSVSAVGGYFSGDGVDGESTRYQNFTIWSIETAP